MALIPFAICRGDPCWCGNHRDKNAPRTDGILPYTEEGRERFLTRRAAYRGQRDAQKDALKAKYPEMFKVAIAGDPKRLAPWWKRLLNIS